MKFKDDVIAARFDDMHTKVKEVAIFMDEWSVKNYGIELTITETTTTKEEDSALGRVSDTHRTGRAFDVRTRDLPESLIAELCAATRKAYGKYGAQVNGAASLVVYRPHGSGPHLHIQLNRKFTHIVKEKDNGKT